MGAPKKQQKKNSTMLYHVGPHLVCNRYEQRDLTSCSCMVAVSVCRHHKEWLLCQTPDT